MMLTVDDIAKLLKVNTETVRRYIAKRVLHKHAVGENGRSYLCDERSVKVRYAALARLRANTASLAVLGGAFSSVSGPEDRFILDKLDAGESDKAVLEEFVEAVRQELTSR